jgi:hypothetical protein
MILDDYGWAYPRSIAPSHGQEKSRHALLLPCRATSLSAASWMLLLKSASASPPSCMDQALSRSRCWALEHCMHTVHAWTLGCHVGWSPLNEMISLLLSTPNRCFEIVLVTLQQNNATNTTLWYIWIIPSIAIKKVHNILNNITLNSYATNFFIFIWDKNHELLQ